MADTGKIATEGFGAGAIKYVVLQGFNTNVIGTVNACIVTMGFGLSNAHKIPLIGFVGASSVGSSGAFPVIAGGTVIA
jgi:hypothetical protein